jgi:hypothetical protein
MRAPSHPKELSPSDQTLLVLLAQAGDRVALEQLLRNSHAPLRRYITRLAGADLADDILQETSIQIFRKLTFLREPAARQIQIGPEAHRGHCSRWAFRLHPPEEFCYRLVCLRF